MMNRNFFFFFQPREGESNTVLVNNDQCLVCEGRFNSTDAAIKHYKEHHLNFSYICVVCEIYFKHNASLDVHYVTSHGNSCTPRPSSNPSTSTVHSTSNHADGHEALSSKKSKKNINLKNAAITHKRQAMKSFKEKRCMDCEIDFDSTHEILVHFRIEHKIEVFICGDCNSVYLQRSSLNIHKKMKHAGGAMVS